MGDNCQEGGIYIDMDISDAIFQRLNFNKLKPAAASNNKCFAYFYCLYTRARALNSMRITQREKRFCAMSSRQSI